MSKLSQVGIATTILGGVLIFIGAFPATTGLDITAGVGILQVLLILIGFCVMIFGAYLFVQMTWYRGRPHTLIQSIALRLSMTGLLFSFAVGLADLLGYGSHTPDVSARTFLGLWQAAGLTGGFVVASLGVILFALGGRPQDVR